MHNAFKKTPSDVTEFEQEQLRFFLGECDVTATLAEINPSLAWLPLLARLELINAKTDITPWIQKNFAEIDAIQEVATNIKFFEQEAKETADILEFRLNQTQDLPSLQKKCWRLIINHLGNAQRSALRNDWYEIMPRIKQGEHLPELLNRLTLLLQPRLRVGKRITWVHDDIDRVPERPSDLISVGFEIEERLSDEDVLAAWPEDAEPEFDSKLLTQLTSALSEAIESAIDAGVESNSGYSASDSDVPSVAKHDQNSYRTGFLPIVRVIADLWTRLARKDPQRAQVYVRDWQASQLRLLSRLAIFAAADKTVPSDMAAQILLKLPMSDLFLSSSTVEVHRLIMVRWPDFAPDKQAAIERRIVEGPPAELFRMEQERAIDSCRFDLLTHLKRSGAQLGQEAQRVLDDIRGRWPDWEPRPEEQAGFHIWHGSVHGVADDPSKLSGVPDSDLIEVADKLRNGADLMIGDSWQALCQSDPVRAFRGLDSQVKVGKWPTWALRPFLWAATKLLDEKEIQRVADFLLEWPNDEFSEVADVSTWWLNEKANAIDETRLWSIWDRIKDASIGKIEETNIDCNLDTSINRPSGRLAEVLLKKLTKGSKDQELSEQVRTRLDVLVSDKGQFGRLARIRLVVDVSNLFECAPEWTRKNIIPLFDWSSPDAPTSWSARKYARYIGSSELFGLTKKPFMELFARSDVADDELRIFSEWLVAIMIANQSNQASYPISPAEARSVLRQAGIKSLPSVGHRLAMEMASAKAEEKITKWHDVVGPIFQSIWPLDVDLQTSSATFKLVQILRESGAAFPQAAKVIIPYVRSENSQSHTSVFSISTADEEGVNSFV